MTTIIKKLADCRSQCRGRSNGLHHTEAPGRSFTFFNHLEQRASCHWLTPLRFEIREHVSLVYVSRFTELRSPPEGRGCTYGDQYVMISRYSISSVQYYNYSVLSSVIYNCYTIYEKKL